MIDPAEVAKMKVELQGKTIEQIHYETAMTWAARAIAAQQLYNEGGRQEPRLLLDAYDYAHESLEHGALAKDGGAVVTYLSTVFLPLYRGTK